MLFCDEYFFFFFAMVVQLNFFTLSCQWTLGSLHRSNLVDMKRLVVLIICRLNIVVLLFSNKTLTIRHEACLILKSVSFFSDLGMVFWALKRPFSVGLLLNFNVFQTI